MEGISTNSPIPVETARRRSDWATEAADNARMKALPNIAVLVSQFVLSSADADARKHFARALMRTAIGLVAICEGDWNAAKLARQLAKERVDL